MTITGRLDGTLSDTSELKSLGSNGTEYTYSGASKALLEHFPNPMANELGARGTIEIRAPEFTSLCPKTGQPDFATIVISYEPRERCVESKSLKLYFNSFRQTGEFHEACVTRIGTDLVELLQPYSLRVVGEFTPRGGIAFWPTFEYTAPVEIVMEEVGSAVRSGFKIKGDKPGDGHISADAISASSISLASIPVGKADPIPVIHARVGSHIDHQREILDTNRVLSTDESMLIDYVSRMNNERKPGGPTIGQVRATFADLDEHLGIARSGDDTIVAAFKRGARHRFAYDMMRGDEERMYREGRISGYTLLCVYDDAVHALASYRDSSRPSN